MANQELVDYLAGNLGKFKAEQLRSKLVSEGISLQDIDQAFDAVLHNRLQAAKKQTSWGPWIFAAQAVLALAVWYGVVHWIRRISVQATQSAPVPAVVKASEDSTTAPKIPDDQFTKLTRMARAGDADAQLDLGLLLFQGGLGVARDDVKAREWLLLAARQGKAEAQFRVAYMFQNATGGPRDIQEAVKWYTIAAARKHGGALTDLGHLYAKGEGVEKNIEKAGKIWVLASRQGEPTAMYSLGQLYAASKPRSREFVECYKWNYMASVQAQKLGNKVVLDNASDMLKRLENVLDPNQISEAKRLAKIELKSIPPQKPAVSKDK